MDHFLPVFIEHHVQQLSVAREMSGMITRYFGPLRGLPLASITPLTVEAWFHAIGQHSHAQANKSLSILRTMFTKAQDWRLYEGENPTHRIKPYPRFARERFVTQEEMPRLMQALAQEDEVTQCYFLLCLLVGCRRTEALTMQWGDLDGDRQVWRKPTTKTGRSHLVPVPHVLLTRLVALPHRNQWVFATAQGHWSTALTFTRWESIRTAAGLPDVTIHDLRRTCCSWLAIHGENLAIISTGVLNHTRLTNTGIYTRLNVSPVARALEENAVRMLG